MIRSILSFIGSLVFQLFFGVTFAGGLCGLVQVFAEWQEYQDEDFNILPAFAVMLGALVVVGATGIIRFRNPAMRRLDVERDVEPLRLQKPVNNIIVGAMVVIAGITFTWLSWRSAVEQGGGSYSIPLVAMAAGVLQTGFGVHQLIRGKGIPSARPRLVVEGSDVQG